jgi:carbon storage regulator CsrA
MLVLSRRPEEKILLPTAPAVIKVIAAQASMVRLGIEAPAHVPILREELCVGERGITLPGDSAPADAALCAPQLRYAVRNRLNNLVLGLTLLRMQVGKRDPAVRRTLDGIDAELEALRQHIVPAGSPGEPADWLEPAPEAPA